MSASFEAFQAQGGQSEKTRFRIKLHGFRAGDGNRTRTIKTVRNNIPALTELLRAERVWGQEAEFGLFLTPAACDNIVGTTYRGVGRASDE